MKYHEISYDIIGMINVDLLINDTLSSWINMNHQPNSIVSKVHIFLLPIEAQMWNLMIRIGPFV